MSLSIDRVKELVAQAESSFRHGDCATCECYLGYIIQLEIDADQAGRKYLKGVYPSRDDIHACLGCDPCPPGILYADYLRVKTNSTI